MICYYLSDILSALRLMRLNFVISRLYCRETGNENKPQYSIKSAAGRSVRAKLMGPEQIFSARYLLKIYPFKQNHAA